MSGTCSCGKFLWFDTVEQMVELSKELDKNTRTDYVKYINETRQNGVLICHNCGKTYTEQEFSELKDCVGYGEHSQYTNDPNLAYQQAVARGYDHFYRRDLARNPTIILDTVFLIGCLSLLEGLLHYFTSFVRNPYDMSAVAIWDILFIISVLGFFVSFIVLITDIGKVISGRIYRDC